MADPNIKDILNAIAKAAGHVQEQETDTSAVCPHCGGPLEQPEHSEPESDGDADDE